MIKLHQTFFPFVHPKKNGLLLMDTERKRFDPCLAQLARVELPSCPSSNWLRLSRSRCAWISVTYGLTTEGKRSFLTEDLESASTRPGEHGKWGPNKTEDRWDKVGKHTWLSYQSLFRLSQWTQTQSSLNIPFWAAVTLIARQAMLIIRHSKDKEGS